MSEKFDIPAYRFSPADAFPELPTRRSQDTSEALDQVSALALTCAYIVAGQWFKGTLASLTMEEFHKEFERACFMLKVNDSRVLNWAESILIPPEITMTNEQIDEFVPVYIVGKDFKLHPYQRRKAGWA